MNPLSEQARLLKQVIGSSPDLIFVKDRAGKYVEVNDVYAAGFGMSADEMIGHGIELHGDPEVIRTVRAIDNQLFETGEGTHEVGPRVWADGNERWYDVLKSPLYDQNGEVAGLIGIARDITTQQEMEQRLLSQMIWLEHLNDETIKMISQPDRPTDIDRLVNAIARLTNATYVSLYLEPAPESDPLNASETPELVLRGESGESRISASERRALAAEAQRTKSTLALDDLHVHAIPLSADDVRNGIVLSEWHAEPTTEVLTQSWTVARQLGVMLLNKSLIDQTKHRATHDDLTGLANRRHLTSELDIAMTDRTAEDPPVAVIFGDLDGFKQINDTWGHHHGDLLLQLVAKRLKETMRASDTLARLGGDEFAFVIPNGDEATCARFLERITAAVAEPFDIGVGEPVKVGLSIGLAKTPGGGMTPSDLMISADNAMYANKLRRRKQLYI